MKNYFANLQSSRSTKVEIPIARIDLVFDNHEMVRLLKERGLLKYNKDEASLTKLKEVEKAIEDLVTSTEDDGYHNRTKVCGCFITIENNHQEVQRILMKPG